MKKFKKGDIVIDMFGHIEEVREYVEETDVFVARVFLEGHKISYPVDAVFRPSKRDMKKEEKRARLILKFLES